MPAVRKVLRIDRGPRVGATRIHVDTRKVLRIDRGPRVGATRIHVDTREDVDPAAKMLERAGKFGIQSAESKRINPE